MVSCLILLPEQEDREGSSLQGGSCYADTFGWHRPSKTAFHLVALGAAGKVLVKKKFTQRGLLTYIANMQTVAA
jgi:hypothetical protein